MLDTLGKTKKFLKENKNIIIFNSNKGSFTVARYCMTNPICSLQTKNNMLVNKLFNLELCLRNEKNRLRTNRAQPPKIYVLSIIHKKDTPLRPFAL